MSKKYVPGEYLTKALTGNLKKTSKFFSPLSSTTSSKAKNNSGYSQGEYMTKRLYETNVLAKYGIDSFGFETINDDIISASELANTTYSGWQPKDTLNKNRTTIEGVHSRLKAYHEYLDLTGAEKNEDLDKVVEHFDNVLGEWDNIATTYKKYSSAKDYEDHMAEAKKLNELFSMSTDDIKKELKVYSYTPSHRKNSQGNALTTSPLLDTTLTSISQKGTAYTTLDGTKITWEDLYKNASYNELAKEVDIEKNGGFKKKDVEYSTYLTSAGEGDVGFSMGVYISDVYKDAFLYNYVNGEEEARGNGELLNQTMYGTWEGLQNRHLTDDEIKMFNALWEKKGPQTAKNYLASLDSQLRMREIESQREFYADMATESPVGASVASVFANVGNNMMALPLLGADLVEDGTINPESNLYDKRRAVQTIRGTVEENIDNPLGQFVYRHGMNRVDDVAANLVGGYGMLGGLSKGISLGSRISGSVVDSTLDAKERGLSDGKSLVLGAISGAAEGFFESKAFDAFFDKGTLTDSFWKYVVNNIKTELVGEISTEATNDIADYFIAQDLSKLKLEYNSYLQNGDTEKEALLKVVEGVGLRYADVAAGTIFSTGISSGLRAGRGSYQQNQHNTEMGQSIKANDRVGDMFDLANNPEIKSAYDAYTKYAEKGITADNISDAQLGRLHSLASMDAQGTLDSKTSTMAQKDSAQGIIDNLEAYASRDVTSTTSSGKTIGISSEDRVGEKHKDADYVSALVESGLESAEGTEAHTLATEYSQKLKDGKKVSAKEVANLQNALDKEIRAEEVKAVKSYLKENGHDVALAEAVTRQARGETITEAEAEAIEDSGIDIAKVEDAIVEYDGTATETETSEVAEASSEVSIPTEKIEELGLSAETVNVVERKAEGKGITISEAENIIKNEDALNVLADNGNEELANTVKTIAETDADRGSLFLSVYDGKTDLEEFSHSFNLAVDKARNNFTFKDILDTKGVLTNEQTRQIYAETRKKVDQNKRAEFQKLVDKTAKMKAYKGVVDDSVIDYENKSTKGKVNWKDISPERKKEITFVKGLAQIAGLNLEVVTDGEKQGFNGAINIDKNTIYIDVFAEKRVDYKNLESAIIPAFSHELTHWMEYKSPVLFRKVSSIVFSTLQRVDGLTESERIAKEVKRLTKKGIFKETDTDAQKEAFARSEIVARGCEDMLSRSKVGREMFYSLEEKEQKTFVDKIKDIIKNFKEWINGVLKLYDTASTEAKALRRFDAEMDKLSKLWDKMLLESIEVNQALEKSGAFEHNAEVGKKVSKTRELMFNERLIDTHMDSLEDNYSEDSSLPLSEILDRYNKIIDIWKRIGGELKSDFLNDWNNKVGKDRTFTVFKKQVGYKYNVELSSMCKKGIPLFEAIDTIVKQEVMKELDIKVIGKAEKQILYDILKSHNFEIPCAICYVEQARQREGDIIFSFLNGQRDKSTYKLGWNESLERIQTEMEKDGFHYEFPSADRSIATDKYTPSDITMDEETQEHFFKALKKVANEEIRRYNKDNKANKTLITKMDAESLKNVFKGKLPLNMVLFKTLFYEPSSRFMLDEDLLYSSMTTQNLASSHNGLYSLFNSQGGAGGYKSKQGSVIYWGDILKKNWIPATVRNEGGVRNQSNSDFLMYTLLDHAQMYIDFTAKGYYLQAYTKVIPELKLFGLSKGKINASFIPKVVIYHNADGSIDAEKTKLNAGLDENGNPIYDDIEGVNHTEAFMLIEDAEYSKSIGGVCIGYSDAHISKLLDDKRIQLIIGFHDKTDDPTKRYKGAVYAKNYNGINEATKLDSEGKLKTVHIGFNQFIRRAEGKFKSKDTITYNGNSYTKNDIPKLATDLYLEHCEKKGLNPAYSQGGTDFSKHPNYYKLLADFSLYDSNGNYSPHEKVEYNMPDNVPYLDEIGNKAYEKSEDYIKRELKKELDVRDAISESLADKSEEGIIPQFVKRVNELHKGRTNNLRGYSQHQIENWKNSKSIVIYENETQFRSFVENAMSNGQFNKKIYLGAITQEFASLIKEKTNIDVENFNCSLSASEIRKIFKDHGIEEKESPRGQRAVTIDDILNIREVLQNPEDITLSPTKYNGKPVIHFVKEIDGKYTVSAVVSDKHLDLFVQTLYIGIKKRNLATPIAEQAAINTPKANSGTVSNISISPLGENVKLSERDDIGTLIYDMRVEINRLTNEILAFEKSEEYGKAMDSFIEAVNNDDADRGVAEFNKWLEESGYTKKKERRDSLQNELDNLTKSLKESEEDDERKAIEKSGLSEADYFRKQAVKEFGYTPYFYDAGYITPNGKMLNFSGEKGMHYGTRGDDHRAIGRIYANISGSEAMIKFMHEGNIRIMAESPGIDISSVVTPTKEQYATIRKFVREYAKENFFNVDITDAEGHTIGNYQYEGRVNAERVVNDIKYFFENGTTREQSSISQFLYSERDDTTVYDIMGETERLNAENAKLDADAEKLKGILGTEEVANRRFLALANYLKKISGSAMDSAKLGKKLKTTYTSMQSSENLTWESIASLTDSIAESVMNNDLGVSSEYFKKVMFEIRKDKISLSKEQRARVEERFGSYGNFHKYVFGRINVTNDGKPLSDIWGNWSKLYPSLFDAKADGAEQIDALLDAVDALKATSTIMGEYEHQEAIRHLSTEIYNQFWNIATDSATVEEAQVYRTEHKALMTELRKDYEQRQKDLAVHPTGESALKYESLLRKFQETKRKEIAKAKEHGREMMDKYKENAERKTKIQSITSVSLSLNEYLIKNSKDKHVPEIMREPVTALLQAIDFSSKRMLTKGEPTKKDISLSKALGKVKDMMVKATNAHEELVELYGHGLDEDIEKMVDSVDNIMRTVGDNEFVLNAMPLEDLKTLDKMVKTIRHAVNKLNQFHTVNHAKGIANLSMESVAYLDSLGKGKVHDGLRGQAEKLLNWNNALPYYVFKRYGSGGMKVYEALMDGWDKFAFNTKQILDYANEAYTSKEVKEWSEEVKTFKILLPANEFELADPDYVPQYQEVQLTVSQIMSMYCLNKREQARGHLFKGGIRVADFKTKKGEIVSQAEGVVFTDKDISTILNSLTDRQKAVADKLQLFLNTVSTDWGNEVSMARFGYKAFGEPNYFPIQSDKNNLAVNDETEQNNSLFRLLNMSFTKSLVDDANNRIVISDIFDVFAQHTSDMAKYNALALPVLDAFKWYNFTEKHDIAEGTFKTKGVKQSIENAFGKDGQNYFVTFLKDINGQQEADREQLSKAFIRGYKIATVSGNLRVMLLQPTSYVRASAVIDNKYLLKASAYIKLEPISMVGKLKKAIANAEKYCGMALWKSMGYYDTNIQKGVETQIKHATTWKDKATEWTMKGAEIADKVTWGALWTACEFEIRDTRKDLKVGSKEYYDAIGKRLREIIYATQVVDSTMTRSQMMRSSKMHDQALTNFASEPTLSYNMIQDAYMQYNLDARRMGKAKALKKNGKRIARIALAYTMTNAVAALIESAFDDLRDEDDEFDIVTFMQYYLKNFASDMSITGKIPYIKELHSIVQGYGLSRTELEWMETMWKSISGVYDNLKGKGNPVTALKNSIKTLSYLSTLPFYNVYRDTMAVLNNLDIISEEELKEILKDSTFYGIWEE